MSETCDFRPFPGSGAYGDWACDLQQRHRGRHRYRNYTIARLPRLHRGARLMAKMWGRWLWRATRSSIEHRSWLFIMPPKGQVLRNLWNHALWPTEYDPVKDSAGYDGAE